MTPSTARFVFRPRVRELPRTLEIPAALRRLAERRGLVVLDGAAGAPRRYSWIGFDPLATTPGELGTPRSVLDLREWLARLRPATGDAVPGPFQGGFLGAFAYDLGAAGEAPVGVAPEPFGFPLALGGLYADFLVRDERAQRTFLVLGEEPGDGRAALPEREAALLDALLGAAPAERPRAAAPAELRRRVSTEEHVARIERVRARIGRGELYQANLAHPFEAAVDADAVELFLALRRANPAPYMGLVVHDEGGRRRGAVVSSSPELLFELEGGAARTRPIKGTAPRHADPARDAASAAALLASEKDRAELTMIVDLCRNDLGRVAVPGGVRVEGLPTLESYARVHHLMADVVARLAPGVDAAAVLGALFPGGSITGAPKLASMRAIAAEEREGRGFFTGSMGWADVGGRAAFNILIRTLLWRPAGTGAGGEVSFRVGGGITWGSEAYAEDRETLHKAAGLVDALGADPGASPGPPGPRTDEVRTIGAAAVD